ncbi:hypothetical protein CL656_05405 [bacterium]|nr:hypothetical protein [bacterium]|tara:strand:+ start:774 stop:1202 length:429 start_codon:yes stop_codon:yes gene_type:complete
MNFFQSIFNNYEKLSKVSYENIQDILKNNDKSYYIINTLNYDLQDILLPNTINCNEEENIINSLINNSNYNFKIIIYGKNNTDESIYKKYIQLKKYGFTNMFIYVGGMFEWLLLQDIYGKELFPTIGFTLNILKYKPDKIIF